MAFTECLLVLAFLHHTSCRTSVTTMFTYDAPSRTSFIALSCAERDRLLVIENVSYEGGVCSKTKTGHLDGSLSACNTEDHIRYQCFGRHTCSNSLPAPKRSNGAWANDLRVQYNCTEKSHFISICDTVDITFNDTFFLSMPWNATLSTSCRCNITPHDSLTYSVMRMARLYSSNNFTIHFIGVMDDKGKPYVSHISHNNSAYLLPEKFYPERNENVTVHIQAAPPGFSGDSRVFLRVGTVGGPARVVCKRERTTPTTRETFGFNTSVNIGKDQVEDSSNSGLIAGIVVSVLLLGIILIGITLYCRKRPLTRRNAQKQEGSPAEQQPLADEPGLIKSPSYHELESPNKVDEENDYAAILEDSNVYSEPVLPYAVSDAMAKGDRSNNSQASASENPYNPIDTFKPSKFRKFDEASCSKPVDVHLASPSPSEYDDPYRATYGAALKSGHAPGEEVVQL